LVIGRCAVPVGILNAFASVVRACEPACGVPARFQNHKILIYGVPTHTPPPPLQCGIGAAGHQPLVDARVQADLRPLLRHAHLRLLLLAGQGARKGGFSGGSSFVLE
jgi:hypothetical protein